VYCAVCGYRGTIWHNLGISLAAARNALSKAERPLNGPHRDVNATEDAPLLPTAVELSLLYSDRNLSHFRAIISPRAVIATEMLLQSTTSGLQK
jgi:hypothetical protein